MEEQEKIIEETDADGGWVDTHHFANLSEQVLEMTLSGKDDQKTANTSNSNKTETEEDNDEDEGEPEDMDNYMASGLVDEMDEVWVNWFEFMFDFDLINKRPLWMS